MFRTLLSSHECKHNTIIKMKVNVFGFDRVKHVNIYQRGIRVVNETVQVCRSFVYNVKHTVSGGLISGC